MIVPHIQISFLSVSMRIACAGFIFSAPQRYSNDLQTGDRSKHAHDMGEQLKTVTIPVQSFCEELITCLLSKVLPVGPQSREQTEPAIDATKDFDAVKNSRR